MYPAKPWLFAFDVQEASLALDRLKVVENSLRGLGAYEHAYLVEFAARCIERVLPRLRYEAGQDARPFVSRFPDEYAGPETEVVW